MLASDYGFTGSLSKPTLAEGTNANTIKITNAGGYDYAINGVIYTKATTDNIAMTALTTQAVLTACGYLVKLDSAGTVSMKKGTDVSAADYALAGNTVQIPAPDANRCPVGAIKIVLASTATFTSGPTDLSAANVTATFTDLAGAVVRV